MRYLSDDLPALQAEFPGYSIDIGRTYYGPSFVAERIGQGDGPLVVISNNPDELRQQLTRKDWTP